MDFQTFNVEIQNLRRKMEERDNEIQETLHLNNEKEKQRFIQSKAEKEELQRKIEELTVKSRDLQIDYKDYFDKTEKEVHYAKRDFFVVQEEKRMLIKRVSELQQDLEYIKEDYEKKVKNAYYYEQELVNLQEKYRDLSNKEAENSRIKNTLEIELKTRNEEIDIQSKTFTENLNILRKTSGYDSLRDDYERKLNNAMERKEYYKQKVNKYK